MRSFGVWVVAASPQGRSKFEVRPFVNFINVLRLHFLYEHCFGSLHVCRKSCRNDVCTKNSYVKCWWNWHIFFVDHLLRHHWFKEKEKKRTESVEARHRRTHPLPISHLETTGYSNYKSFRWLTSLKPKFKKGCSFLWTPTYEQKLERKNEAKVIPFILDNNTYKVQ